MASLHYLGDRLASAVSNAVPRPLLNGLTYAASTLCLFLDRRGRRAVYANLRTLFEHAGRRHGRFGLWRQVWHVFINYGKFMTEFLGDRKFGRRWLARRVAVHGREHLDEALARHGACIFLTAHYGNWELLGGKMIQLGYRGVGVGAEWPDPKLRLLLRRFRSNRGYYMFTFAGAARSLLKCLRGGVSVFMVGDRNVATDAGVEVELLGRQVRFPRGPERMAMAAGVPIVPAFSRRLPDDRLEVVIHPSILSPPQSEVPDQEERVRVMAQAFARALEAQLVAQPSQWNGAFVEELGTCARTPRRGAGPDLSARSGA